MCIERLINQFGKQPFSINNHGILISSPLNDVIMLIAILKSVTVLIELLTEYRLYLNLFWNCVIYKFLALLSLQNVSTDSYSYPLFLEYFSPNCAGIIATYIPIEGGKPAKNNHLAIKYSYLWSSLLQDEYIWFIHLIGDAAYVAANHRTYLPILLLAGLLLIALVVYIILFRKLKPNYNTLKDDYSHIKDDDANQSCCNKMIKRLADSEATTLLS